MATLISLILKIVINIRSCQFKLKFVYCMEESKFVYFCVLLLNNKKEYFFKLKRNYTFVINYNK